MEIEETEIFVQDGFSNNVSIKSDVDIRTHFSRSSSSVKLKVDKIQICKKIFFLLIISFSALSAINCSTMFLPFYANFAESAKNVKPDIVGNITGIFYFGVFVCCIILGIFIEFFGPKFLYFTGYLVLSSSLFLFGFVDRMDTFWFIFFSFVLILVMSYSLGAIYTSSYSIGMALFPDHQNTVLAIIDTIAGVGYITGPIIGGLIYDKLGWFWAYAFNALFVLLAFIVSIFILPVIKIAKVESESIMDYLNIFRLLPNINILSVVLVNLVVTIGWSYKFTSFGPFLARTYNSSSETIGYLFSLQSVSYIIMLPVIGILSERTVSRLFIWMSLPIMIISLILTPPLYYIFTDRFYVPRPGINQTLFPLPTGPSDTNYLFVSVIGQIIFGIAYTFAYAPLFIDMKRNVSEKNMEKLPNLPGILSSIRVANYFLASGIGPIISGVMEEHLTFDDETLIIILVASIILVVFTPLSIGNVVYKIVYRKTLTLDMF